MNDIQIAVEKALAEQPWYVQRKDTIAAVAASLLYFLDAAAIQGTDLPAWGGAAFAVFVFIAQIFVHGGTKGAITPSMGERLSEHAPAPDQALAAGAEANELAGTAVPNPHDPRPATDYPDSE